VGHALASHELARLEHDAGNTELADSLYRVAQAWLTDAAGPRSAAIGWIERDRADLAAGLGRYDQADSLFAAARTNLAAGGEDPSQLLLLDLDYLELLHLRGDTEREDSLYARILANREHLASDRLITLAKGMIELGIQATYRGDLERAEPLVEGAIELRRQAYGELHSDVAAGLCHLSEVQWASGRRDQASRPTGSASECSVRRLAASTPSMQCSSAHSASS
jgi:tetratricopeptide (TPR) repeat protein